MKMVIFGGTGFIGSALTSYWLDKGYQVVIVTRQSKKTQDNRANSSLTYVTWEQLEQTPEIQQNVKAVVNLVGATLSQRWTSKAKTAILQSRIDSTKLIANWITSLEHKPEVVIQGSAVGIYGTSLTKQFDESAVNNSVDFLSDVTSQWEEAADRGFNNLRLVKLRTGVVLGNNGGAYPLMSLPYKLGVGGRVGSGEQWVPWVHIADIVKLIDFCVFHEHISGPINAVSPYAVTNNQFGATIADVYRRPHWLPVPSFVLKTLLGDMSSLLLEGQHVVPHVALSHGFEFKYPKLHEALADLK